MLNTHQNVGPCERKMDSVQLPVFGHFLIISLFWGERAKFVTATAEISIRLKNFPISHPNIRITLFWVKQYHFRLKRFS